MTRRRLLAFLGLPPFGFAACLPRGGDSHPPDAVPRRGVHPRLCDRLPPCVPLPPCAPLRPSARRAASARFSASARAVSSRARASDSRPCRSRSSRSRASRASRSARSRSARSRASRASRSARLVHGRHAHAPHVPHSPLARERPLHRLHGRVGRLTPPRRLRARARPCFTLFALAFRASPVGGFPSMTLASLTRLARALPLRVPRLPCRDARGFALFTHLTFTRRGLFRLARLTRVACFAHPARLARHERPGLRSACASRGVRARGALLGGRLAIRCAEQPYHPAAPAAIRIGERPHSTGAPRPASDRWPPRARAAGSGAAAASDAVARHGATAGRTPARAVTGAALRRR